MPSAAQDAETFRQAAALNREDPLLVGSTLVFPDYGQVVMTGDVHGHRRNLERIQTYCDLTHCPARHVILHELIHEEPEGLGTPDLSHQVLLDAARWKCDYPDQVHFLQSNHELAQLSSQDICKGGRLVVFNFAMGVREVYGSGADQVLRGISEFIRSYALVGRTPNRILLAHSLPAPNAVSLFDPQVLSRPLSNEDLLEGGSAYLLVWGRYQTPALLERMARMLDVDYFICGHQPQESGYEVLHERMLILASDHNHGVILPFDPRKKYDMAGLERQIRPLASIA